ncbi:unnamed protein product [marine sediment metagenome]|uniref:Uncharacterized protein n=1 Tax=marine sediment metagenome TaxID=412755 RepID=X1N1C1_9ZZZZ
MNTNRPALLRKPNNIGFYLFRCSHHQIRKQMEKDGEAGYEDLAERSSEPNYVSEGQRGYVSVDKEAD